MIFTFKIQLYEDDSGSELEDSESDKEIYLLEKYFVNYTLLFSKTLISFKATRSVATKTTRTTPTT